MDKFTMEAMKHGAIFEWLAVFHKTIGSIEDVDFLSFRSFLNGDLNDHFLFEENKWFPLIHKKGNHEEIELIQNLKHQHEKIQCLIFTYNELLSKRGFDCDALQQKKLMFLRKKIVHDLFEHAQQEDLELFPILKRHHVTFVPENKKPG